MQLKSILLCLTLALALQGCKSSASTGVNASDDCVENGKENCMCTKQYDPVCGCNNKTYGNSCEAECNGITSYTKGACE